MVDILHKSKDGWQIYEVKSSTSLKEVYIQDAAIQHYVLSGCGLKITKTSIVLIDNSYIRSDELEIDKLFKIVNVDEEVEIYLKDIPTYHESFVSVLMDSENEPDIDIGYPCNHPYECDAKEYCWGKQRDIPEYSVFDLFTFGKNSKALKLYHDGIVDVKDIPDDFTLTDNQSLAVNSWKMDRAYIDKEKISSFLNDLTYPIYHLDFETYQEAIPSFSGTKPFEQIPFQYSLHIEYEDGRLEHREFLAKEGSDPREELAKSLIKDIPKDVMLMAYNASFEKMVLNNLSKSFPIYSKYLDSFVENIVDLAEPFQKKYYYLPQMKGKYSIKIVLPLLVPDMAKAYKDLSLVSNGGDAMNTFPSLKDMDSEKREKYREALLKYCKLDTLAMVKVLEKLREAV